MEGDANVQITVQIVIVITAGGPKRRLESGHKQPPACPLAGRQSNFLHSKAIHVNAGNLRANLH